MIAVTDVHYAAAGAYGAVVLADEWTDAAPCRERRVRVAGVEAYQPGAFYLRELPALQEALAEVSAGLAAVVVDGYAWLGPRLPGLGARLWAALGERVPVVGIAKSRFAGADAVEVLRGQSRRPLYVTAAGMRAADAAEHVARMHGPHRIPTLVTRADHLARGLAPARL